MALALSSTEQVKLWKLDFAIAKLGKQLTVADSTKDQDTNLALARAVILPNDVANLWGHRKFVIC